LVVTKNLPPAAFDPTEGLVTRHLAPEVKYDGESFAPTSVHVRRSTPPVPADLYTVVSVAAWLQRLGGGPRSVLVDEPDAESIEAELTKAGVAVRKTAHVETTYTIGVDRPPLK
jgi:hypothetical protein